MKRSAEKRTDVVVVGSGPVGLLSAIELTLGGASVLVLERLAEPSMVSKALGMGPLGIEALQRRGMAAAISAAEYQPSSTMKTSVGSAQTAKSQTPKFSGHFAGLTLIRTDTQREPERRLRLINQQAAEAMLAGRAQALGIEVRRGCEVNSLVQQADGIDVQWVSSAAAGSLQCSYLIGCDGGRSAVRKLAGFEFPGTPPTLTLYNVVAELDHPERLEPGGWQHTPGGMYSSFAGRLILLDFSGPPADREAPVTREEVEAVLRQVSGADVRVTALESGNRWTDNTRLVDTYRRGRVLLAGDAAHIHSPFGGQGMSLGLVDAANLGWKLAAVIRGEMPEHLLDTYTTERWPVAEAVLANTRAQAAIMRPDPQSAAMRGIVAQLMELGDVNRFMGEMMTGLSTPYDLGSQRAEVGRLLGDRPIRQGDGETCDGEISLYALMQGGLGVFLDATGGEASRRVEASTPRVRCVAVYSGPSMLIRPDACVAWAGGEDDLGGLEAALRRWFGPVIPAWHGAAPLDSIGRGGSGAA